MNSKNPKFWALIGFGVGAVIAATGTIRSPLDSFIGGLISAGIWSGVSSLILRTQNKKAPKINRRSDSYANASTKKITFKSCDNCGKEMDSNWLHCPVCSGTTFTHRQKESNSLEYSSEEAMSDAFPTTNLSPEIANPEFKTCPMCAEQIKFAAKKCRYCQHMMEI